MPIEELKHACGLFGIYATDKNVAWLTVRALDGQQTRGQEGAGIATTDGQGFFLERKRGLVIQAFPNQESVVELKGHIAIGHVRYSTTGFDRECNVQPLRVAGPNGEICLGHNGNLINAAELREELERKGVVFESTTDSEVIAQLLVRAPGKGWVERLRSVMDKIVGSYCLVILTRHAIILARDPSGNRPLTIGKTDGYWAAASESGVFHNQPTEFLREVEPGEIVVLHEDAGMLSYPNPENKEKKGLCTFEWIYFMRPDSMFGGKESAEVRLRAGRILAENYPVKADLVVPVPRSGFYAADGYSEVSGIPIRHAIVSNVNKRVFLNPNAGERESDYELKYSVVQSIAGKDIVLMDDSWVRGNSSSRVLHMLKKAGAGEIHYFSTYYLILNPCYFGIDMATRRELIAARWGLKTKEEIEKLLAQHWEIASAHCLSRNELAQAIGLPEEILCTGCGGGDYAYPLTADFHKDQFEAAAARF